MLIAILVVLLGVFLGGTLVDGAETLAAIPSVDSTDRTEAEVALFRAVNYERQRHGLQPLEWDGQLVLQSRHHTLRQIGSGMHHSGLGAENVAVGQADTQQVMNTWMNSSGHRANILGGFRFFGGSGFRGRGGSCYWTQRFR